MNHWNFQELHETPSQTGGPYVHIGLLPQQANIKVFENNFNNQLVQENTLGERIRLEGQVFDGLGLPLRDVLIEIWQADANGVYPSTAIFKIKWSIQTSSVGDVQAQTSKLVFGVSIPLNLVRFRDGKVQLRHRILH